MWKSEISGIYILRQQRWLQVKNLYFKTWKQIHNVRHSQGQNTGRSQVICKQSKLSKRQSQTPLYVISLGSPWLCSLIVPQCVEDVRVWQEGCCQGALDWALRMWVQGISGMGGQACISLCWFLIEIWRCLCRGEWISLDFRPTSWLALWTYPLSWG